ncbi:hypothetical protein NKDENANG_01903 [Candidatus Entotheonellaceae bacterium PAL068K]
MIANSEFGSVFGLWYQSDGEKGEEPYAALKEVMAKYKQGLTATPEERLQLGKQIWQIVIEEQWAIGLVGLSPAFLGLRVAKTDLGNIPSRQFNSPDTKTPGISRPVTFFWKSATNRRPQALTDP